MTDYHRFSRRRFIGAAAIAGGAVAVPLALSRAGGSSQQALLSADAGTGGSTIGDTTTSTAAPASDVTATDTVLVAIHLDGGNDGLNTIVPTADALYRSLRGEGVVDSDNIEKLDDTWGLASMPYLASRWDVDELAVVHGVGIRDGTLSHFEAVDMWNAADTGNTMYDGWGGRAVEAIAGEQADPLTGVCVGGFSQALMGRSWSPFTLPIDTELPWTSEFVEANPGLVAGLQSMLDGPYEGLAGEVVSSHLQLKDVGERIDAARPDGEGRGGSGRANTGEISRSLEVVADVVNADLGTRIFNVSHGGFDTHANQLASHPDLLTLLDDALSAFHDRLGENREKVVVMVWTEFGRRVAFNGSGTDHGAASVGLVLGSAVAGGHHGEAPDLAALDQAGNLPVTTDFRDYLTGVCSSALGVGPDVISPSATPLEVLT